MRWRKISLIGVGLLGGSLGLALKRRALVGQVEGYVRRESSIAESLKNGAVDRATCDLSLAVDDADLIVLCTPLAQMRPLCEAMLPHLKRGAVVTDVGSVKTSVLRELTPLFENSGTFFVGSHPMAGSERMGVSFAKADLFEKAVCVVTPDSATPSHITDEVETLWRSVGCRILRLPPGLHDELVSRSSHLPHVLATILADYVLGPEQPPEQQMLCAGGFRDSTRIASGSPEMWRDIVIANRQAALKTIKDFSARLEEFKGLLERADPNAIGDFFQQAKSRRDAWTPPSDPSLNE
jgi:prephenate dehydrogenase